MKRIFLTVTTVAIFFLTNYFTVAQFDGGKGTVDEPYQIRTKAHLEELNDSIDYSGTWNWSRDKYFILMNDITDTVRTIIGNNRGVFSGNFDGQGFKIVLGINNDINNTVGTGLFGSIAQTEEDCTISNLTVEGYVIGSDRVEIGAIIGMISSEEYTIIKNCVNNCTVIGKYITGGIIGYGINCKIENCINNGNIQGLSFVGGIVGSYMTPSKRINDPQYYIRNCINYGFIQGGSNIGGIAGRFMHYSNGTNLTVSNCINIGVIIGKSETGCIIGYKSSSVTVENCHFDKQMCSGNGIGGE